MNKTTEELVTKELTAALSAKSGEELLVALYRMAKLADVLDQTGSAKDADILDSVIKEASLAKEGQMGLGALSGILSAVWDWISGKKQDLTDIILKAVMGGLAGSLTGLIMEKLEDVPVAKYLTMIPGFETVVSGAVSFTVAEEEQPIREFVTKLVENLYHKAKQAIGLEKEELQKEQQTQPSAQPTAQSVKPEPLAGVKPAEQPRPDLAQQFRGALNG